METYNNIV